MKNTEANNIEAENTDRCKENVSLLAVCRFWLKKKKSNQKQTQQSLFPVFIRFHAFLFQSTKVTLLTLQP